VNYRLKIVRYNKPKVLTGLSQNGKGFGQVLVLCLRKQHSPSQEIDPKPFNVILTELGKPVQFPVSPQGKLTARKTDDCAGKGGWKKRKPVCNEQDRGFCLTAKAGRLPSGTLLRLTCIKLTNQNAEGVSL
jgi:hypothetical protein